ncbi:toll-like receptor 2 [Amphiura filiformis]|uniref:toll-like receptor 2 n=1 Tax=Amphiura filiformis TaxID=82378 RepID=UPI003B21BBD9
MQRWDSSLTKISISYSRFVGIHHALFQKIPLLRSLDLSYQGVLEILSDDAFYGLKYLEELILSHNSFTEVPSNAFKVFTRYKTLQKLDLSYNRISGTIPVDAFAGVPSLTYLNLAGNYKIDFRKDWTAPLVQLIELNLKDTYISMFYAPTMPSLRIISLGVPTVSLDDLLIKNKLCNVASGLEQALIPNYSFMVPAVDILGDHCPTLSELDISGCLTFSEQYAIQQKNMTLPRLEKLNVAHNKLRSLLDILFILAPGLLDLDVSYNEIQSIESRVLPILDRLTHLRLDGNKIISINGLQHLTLLTNLYAAENEITIIPQELLHRRNKSSLMVLDLGKNPFDCSCNISDFQHWIMTDTTTWLFQSGPYICTTPEHVKGLSITEVKLDCKSKLPIYLGAGIACVLLIVICITTAVYYRWHIKYKLFLVFKRRYRRFTSYIDNNDVGDDEIEAPRYIHDYDAYIAYDDNSEENERWVINELRVNLEKRPQPFCLCIKGRDFIPGGSIVETITESIQKSRRTILILSPSFVDSEWCHFEMEMARMRLFHENRDVLILVMLEEVPDDKLTLTLRQLLCRQDYFKWPQDEAGQDLFWRRLREEIKKPVRVDRRHDP